MSMYAEQTQLVPAIGVTENAPEATALSVPVVAFPQSYDLGMQWGVGLILAGMMKRAKYDRYGKPFAEGMMELKPAYRAYKHRTGVAGAPAWLAWYKRFEVPFLARLGRKPRA